MGRAPSPRMQTAPADPAWPLATHERLVAGLAGWLAAEGRPVDRIDTHISTLLLCGERVYKLRKPLRLGFLDFSTPELRRADCEAEARLNRRTAPELYLGVRAVVGSWDAPRLAPADGATPSGPVLDWALEMRRFDEADVLAHRATLPAGPDGLTPGHIDALAESLARFHLGLPPSPAPFGNSADVRRWMQASVQALRAAGLPPGEQQAVEAVADWVDAAGHRLAPLMDHRQAAGLVREGHGDLHLGNLVLLHGQPVAFDCIEFNDALRHIDVIADAAFPYMDLLAHGLPRLAWRFANAYVEATGDHGGVPLLRYYAVYRALVRAQVAALRTGRPGAPASTRAAADCVAHLRLAQALSRPDPPELWVLCGLSGSGKSTVARQVAEMRGAWRIRSDVERKRLFGLAPTERVAPDRVAKLYGPAATQQTYARLQDLANTLLDAGERVVVDAACLRRRERQALLDRARERQPPVAATLVWCDAPPAVLQQRLLRRAAAGTDPSDATPSVLQAQLGWFEPPQADEPALRVDTDRPADEVEAVCSAFAGGG